MSASSMPGLVPWPATATARARAIVTALRPHVSEARRAFLHAGYAPSHLQWMGVPVPRCRGVVRMARAQLRDAPAREVLALARALARTPFLEARQVGYELIERRADVLALLGRPAIEALGAGNDNWASVDGFATSVTGPAWLAGALTDADVRRWARARDPWWRRTALVSTVALNLPSRGGHGDSRRTLAVCELFSGESDRMLAKALSWALRALVPHDPAAVRRYLRRHHGTLPAVVIREVTKKMNGAAR